MLWYYYISAKSQPVTVVKFSWRTFGLISADMVTSILIISEIFNGQISH